MSVIPIRRPFAPVAAKIVDTDAGTNESADPLTKCGRCRLSFFRHPSIGLGASVMWRLCPPCRRALIGDASKTKSRWS